MEIVENEFKYYKSYLVWMLIFLYIINAILKIVQGHCKMVTHLCYSYFSLEKYLHGKGSLKVFSPLKRIFSALRSLLFLFQSFFIQHSLPSDDKKEEKMDHETLLE